MMGHIVASEWLWLGRLREEKKAVNVWPDLTVDECETQLADLQRFWFYYVGGLTPARLVATLTYVGATLSLGLLLWAWSVLLSSVADQL